MGTVARVEAPWWALSAIQAYLWELLQPQPFVFDSYIDTLLDARLSQVVNENRPLPLGKLKGTMEWYL